MELSIENYVKSIAIEQLAKSPVGEMLKQAMDVMEKFQMYAISFSEKKDEPGMTSVKAITVLAFALLKKIADGKSVGNLSEDDWKEIADSVTKIAVLADDQAYSVFVFHMYAKYIRGSVAELEAIISPEVCDTINSLADELERKEALFIDGTISEVSYIEDCLWISLEAMIKLIATTASLSGSAEIADLAQALATYSFEYGRMVLFKQEQEILTKYIENQYRLDEELENKYSSFLKELQEQAEQFYGLIENAFVDNFREAFLHSILLAQTAGVSGDEILTSVADVDDFFLN